METARMTYLFGRYGPGYAAVFFIALYGLSELVNVEFGVLSLGATMAGVLLLAWTFNTVDEYGDPGTTKVTDGGTPSTTIARFRASHVSTSLKLTFFAAGLVVVGFVVLAEFARL